TRPGVSAGAPALSSPPFTPTPHHRACHADRAGGSLSAMSSPRAGQSPDLPPAIAAASDPDRVRAHGHELIDAIADALARWHRRDGLVLPWRNPDEALAMWSRKGFGGADLVVQLRRIMASSTAIAHPRFMGHQVPPPLPGAALAELVSALLNNGMAIFE